MGQRPADGVKIDETKPVTKADEIKAAQDAYNAELDKKMAEIEPLKPVTPTCIDGNGVTLAEVRMTDKGEPYLYIRESGLFPDQAALLSAFVLEWFQPKEVIVEPAPKS